MHEQKDYAWHRMIVVTASHGEKFHGWLPSEVADINSAYTYLANCKSAGRAIKLLDVRNLLTQVHTQQISGSTQQVSLMVLMPIDMFPGPIPSYSVYPSSWYFPIENVGCKKPMQQLLVNAERTEVHNKAIISGITPATPGDLKGLSPH